MSGVAAVFKRELASYFATPIAYVFIVIFLDRCRRWFTFFYGDFYERGQADLAAVLQLPSVALPVPRAGVSHAAVGRGAQVAAASSC